MSLGTLNGTNYMANHQVAPQILQGTPNFNVEVSEGQTPPGEFFPAPYLPIVISENRLMGSGYVLMPGKVIALDGNKRLIPAGLAMDVRKIKAAAVPLADPYVSAYRKYSSLDVQNQTIGLSGTFVSDGDEVAQTLVDHNLKATEPVGIMRYSALQAPGSDPSNPATFYKHSYDTGGVRAFTRWCYIQVPVVEVNKRVETIASGVTNHRITLYPGTALTIKKSGVVQFATLGSVKALPNMLVQTTGVPTQYAMLGRTILFNGVTDAGWTVEYTPKLDLPFTSMTIDTGANIVDNNSLQISDFIGEVVGYDIESNFRFMGATTDQFKVGRILDMKLGVNEDLKLVRTYFRDFGLWQEQPGYATDGRNTQLSIANAPKYIARIAVNFNLFY